MESDSLEKVLKEDIEDFFKDLNNLKKMIKEIMSLDTNNSDALKKKKEEIPNMIYYIIDYNTRDKCIIKYLINYIYAKYQDLSTHYSLKAVQLVCRDYVNIIYKNIDLIKAERNPNDMKYLVLLVQFFGEAMYLGLQVANNYERKFYTYIVDINLSPQLNDKLVYIY
jgi:hypothetical protein